MPRSEQLVVEFPPLNYVLEGDTWVDTGVDDRLSKYRVIDFGASPYAGFALETTIDLAGFMQDEDTILVPQMYVIQDPGFYISKTGDDDYTNSAGLLILQEIVTTRRLNLNTVFNDLFFTLTSAGTPFSIYDKQQIVLGEDRALVPNLPVYEPAGGTLINSPGISVLNRQSSFGYTEKIANQKLFAYRLLLPLLDGDGDTIVAPPLRIRMEVAVDKVSAPEYIFALKRNVELDQS